MLLDIAKLLLQKKLVNFQHLKKVLEDEDNMSIKNFKDSLVNSGFIDTKILEDSIRNNFGANIEDIKNISIDDDILQYISKETAVAQLVLPIRISDSKLVVAMTDPTDLFLLDQLGFESGLAIAPVIASKETIRNAVIKNYKVDFHDSNVEIAPIDYSNSKEKILNELEKFKDITNSEETENPQTSFESTQQRIDNKKEFDISATMQNEELSVEFENDIETGFSNTSEKLATNYNPFASAVSSEYHVGPLSEMTEELSHKMHSKEDIIKENETDDIELEELNSNESSENLTENSNPFTSPGSRKEFSYQDSTPDLTEHLSRVVHNDDILENEETEHIELEELKAGNDSQSLLQSDNPFASTATFDSSHEMESLENESDSANNPFQVQSDTVSTEISTKLKENVEYLSPPPNDSEEPEPQSFDQVEEKIPEKRTDINILIVDKTVTMQKIIRQTLEKKGYIVSISNNAIDAISKINKSKPDLIILDIKLPHMDGYQLCKTIKKNSETKDIPIIMMSGKDGLLDKMKGKMSGANEYLIKPFNPLHLTSAIEKLTEN